MAHAFNIRLPNPELHGYAQKYCFLNGPDPELNRALRQAVLDSKRVLADEHDSGRLVFAGLEEQRRIEEELRATLQIPVEMGVTAETREAWIRNLGWKVAAIPPGASSVVVLGSATCREAVFIRQRFPRARIVCTDFVDSRLPNVERALNIEFSIGDFNDLLERNPGAFDVVFSNHVLEHLFDPGRTLRLARQALRPGGSLVSALPLDGQRGTPFSGVLNASRLHPLDMVTVDVAHAWKTNISALTNELHAAGFESINFKSRDKYFSYMDRAFADRRAFDRSAQRGLLLNRILFAFPRAVLKRIFPTEVPRIVSRAVFGAESRVWFGSNRLKNEFSVECLLVAR